METAKKRQAEGKGEDTELRGKRARGEEEGAAVLGNLVPIEESLGVLATRMAEAQASSWLNNIVPIIQRKVFDTAKRGLFHCQMRFEDDVPQDPVNQLRIKKLLEKQNLFCEFAMVQFDEQRGMPGNVTITIHWGPEYL